MTADLPLEVRSRERQGDGVARSQPALVFAGVGALIVLAWSITFLLTSAPDADEGFYLYAARQVWHGSILYRDFAFTQMPLAPYLYGVTQFIPAPPFLAGRVASLLLLIATAVAVYLAAKKAGGPWAGALACGLLAAFSYGLFYMSVIRTYSIVSALLCWSAYCIWQSRGRGWMLIAVVALAGLAVLARLSAVAYAVVIAAYAFSLTRKWQSRLGIMAVVLVLASLTGWFFVQDVESTKWSLVTYHTDDWSSLPVLARLDILVGRRLPAVVERYWPYLLGVSVILLLAARVRMWRVDPTAYVVLFAATAFGASHLFAGRFNGDYFVSPLIAAIPAIATLGTRVISDTRNGTPGRLSAVAAVCCMLIAPSLGGRAFLSEAGWTRSPHVMAAEAGAWIRDQVGSEGQLLALEGIWLAVAADRPVLRGLEMGPFSLHNLDAKQAERVKGVNWRMLDAAVREQEAQMIVLNARDFDRIVWVYGGEDFVATLNSHYKLVQPETTLVGEAAAFQFYVPRNR